MRLGHFHSISRVQTVGERGMIPVTRTRVVVVVAMRELVFNCSSDTAALENEEFFWILQYFLCTRSKFHQMSVKATNPPY